VVYSKRGLKVIREEVLVLLVIELSRFVNISSTTGNLGYEISSFSGGVLKLKGLNLIVKLE